MKERPILFSGPMVRAILDGRKTQTRRAISIKTSTGKDILRDDPGAWNLYDVKDDFGRVQACFNYTKADYWQHMGPLCPYGQPGDRLWVRETHWLNKSERLAAYRADGEFPKTLTSSLKWRPSIHMPRWASRLTLEIVNVRVERLQDISEADAVAEGILTSKGRGLIDGETCYMMTNNSGYMRGPLGAVVAYQDLWESINGPGSWAANPWVWVVEFRGVE